jgi:hypothetical protein
MFFPQEAMAEARVLEHQQQPLLTSPTLSKPLLHPVLPAVREEDKETTSSA